MKNIVNKNQEGYGYKYTDIAEIHRYLEQNNMSYIQKIERIEGDDYIFTKKRNGDIWEEDWLQGCRVVNATLSGIKNPAQEQGSALTYARRYSLLMAFGLATDDDDAQSLSMPAINSLEEAKAYRLTWGKYAGKTLGEIDENYLQWLLANTKDETIKTACDFIINHITKDDIDLLAKFEELLATTDTDREKLYEHYRVANNKELTKEQLQDACKIMESKK